SRCMDCSAAGSETPAGMVRAGPLPNSPSSPAQPITTSSSAQMCWSQSSCHSSQRPCRTQRRLAWACSKAGHEKRFQGSMTDHSILEGKEQMSEQAPVTTLQPEYSSANATPTAWAEARSQLETAEVFWLSTV